MNNYSFIDYGTGSYPLPPHGPHERNLLIVSLPPLKGPCFLIASIPYCEQVGEYRQDGAK